MVIEVVSGLLSGIAGGMGIGGGALLIPALTVLAGLEQHSAQAANLIFFIPTAVSALVIHVKNKSIDVKKAWILALAGAIGAVLGSVLAGKISGRLLRKMFAIFLAVFGVNELIKKEKNK